MSPRCIERLVLLQHASLVWFHSHILAGFAYAHACATPIHLQWRCPQYLPWQEDKEEVWSKKSLSSFWGPSTGLIPGNHCLAYTMWGYSLPSKLSHGPKGGEVSAPSSCWLCSRVTHCVSILCHHKGVLLTCGQLLLHEDPKAFLCNTDPHLVCLQPMLLHGVASSRV